MGFLVAEKTLTEQIYLTVLWGLLVAMYAVALVLYWRQRLVDVIAVRNVSTVFLWILSMWTALATYEVRNVWAQFAECEGYAWYVWRHHTCSQSSEAHRLGSCAVCRIWWINSWSFAGLLSLSIYRCVEVIVRFESQRVALSLQLHQEGYVEMTSLNWFQRNLEWLKSWQPKLSLLLVSLITPIVRIAVPLQHHEATCLPVDIVRPCLVGCALSWFALVCSLPTPV
jgi:hypothetical protein